MQRLRRTQAQWLAAMWRATEACAVDMSAATLATLLQAVDTFAWHSPPPPAWQRAMAAAVEARAAGPRCHPHTKVLLVRGAQRLRLPVRGQLAADVLAGLQQLQQLRTLSASDLCTLLRAHKELGSPLLRPAVAAVMEVRVRVCGPGGGGCRCKLVGEGDSQRVAGCAVGWGVVTMGGKN